MRNGTQLGACAKCRRVFRLVIVEWKVHQVEACAWDPEAGDFPLLGEVFDDSTAGEFTFVETAFHEAGHAVLHHGFGGQVERVMIRRTPDRQGQLGLMDPGVSRESENVRSNPAALIMLTMAGAKAANLAMNEWSCPVPDGGPDAHQIRLAMREALSRVVRVRHWAGGDPGHSTHLVPEEWSVAYEEKLDAALWRMLHRQKRPWRAVRAVVKALLVNPTILGDEAFRKIVAPTGFRRGSLWRLLYAVEMEALTL